jgi:molybdate transport system ATP-binding protein
MEWPMNPLPLPLEVWFTKAFAPRLRRFAVGVQFTVPAGVTVIFGPSGAGKTTILECIAGLLRPDAGAISIGGERVFDSAHRIDLPPQQRGVGYVFQDLALFPHLTAEENIGFGLRKNGTDSGSTRLVRDVMERFRIAHVARHRPGEISGGERQRVALARALVTQPRLLLLDEPFSALDDALKLEIIADLKQWLSRLNIPALFVTHDRSEAEALGHRMLHLSEGAIVGESQIRVSPSSPTWEKAITRG